MPKTKQQLIKKLNKKMAELTAEGFKPEDYKSGKRMAQTRYGAAKNARKRIKSGSRNFGIYWDPIGYSYLLKGQSKRSPGWQTIIEFP